MVREKVSQSALKAKMHKLQPLESAATETVAFLLFKWFVCFSPLLPRSLNDVNAVYACRHPGSRLNRENATLNVHDTYRERGKETLSHVLSSNYD